jgi:hypothetical protein
LREEIEGESSAGACLFVNISSIGSTNISTFKRDAEMGLLAAAVASNGEGLSGASRPAIARRKICGPRRQQSGSGDNL